MPTEAVLPRACTSTERRQANFVTTADGAANEPEHAYRSRPRAAPASRRQPGHNFQRQPQETHHCPNRRPSKKESGIPPMRPHDKENFNPHTKATPTHTSTRVSRGGRPQQDEARQPPQGGGRATKATTPAHKKRKTEARTRQTAQERDPSKPTLAKPHERDPTNRKEHATRTTRCAPTPPRELWPPPTPPPDTPEQTPPRQTRSFTQNI